MAFVGLSTVGFLRGNPDSLLYGTDYRGQVCGSGDAPPGFDAIVQGRTPPLRWQDPVWSNNRLLWFPVPPNATARISASDVLAMGVCVRECPALPRSVAAELQRLSFNTRGATSEALDWATVATYGNVSVTGGTVHADELHVVAYDSDSFYRRCLPARQHDANATAAFGALVAALPGGTSTTNFFFRGLLEVRAAWRVVLIAGAAALVCSGIYVLLMRAAVGPLTYVCLIAILAGLAAAAFFCWRQRERLREDNASDPPNAEMRRYEDFYLAGCIVFSVLAFLYLCLLVFMWNKIKEAIAMMTVGSRVLDADPKMLAVPPIVSVAVVALAFWCIYVALYLYTVDAYRDGVPALRLLPFNDTALMPPGTVLSVFDNVSYFNATRGELVRDESVTYTLPYVLFGFLWSMGVLNGIGFMVIAFSALCWYFSSRDDGAKAIEPTALRTHVFWTLAYHLGTVALGSFIVAVVQLLRALFYYISVLSSRVDDERAWRCTACLAGCCLRYFACCLKLLSKNGFIVCCITNQWFFCASARAADYLCDNAAAASVLMLLCEIVALVGKALIVIGCCALAWTLLDDPHLAVAVETKIFPLLVVAVSAYVISAVFFNVYTTSIDACFIAYAHDSKVNSLDGEKPYTPDDLARLIDDYDAERARKRFDAYQAERTARNEPLDDR